MKSLLTRLLRFLGFRRFSKTKKELLTDVAVALYGTGLIDTECLLGSLSLEGYISKGDVKNIKEAVESRYSVKRAKAVIEFNRIKAMRTSFEKDYAVIYFCQKYGVIARNMMEDYATEKLGINFTLKNMKEFYCE